MPATYNEKPLRDYLKWLTELGGFPLTNTTPTHVTREHWLNLYLRKIAPACVVSKINPNNPIWAPAEGWTKLWRFCTQEDLKYAGNDPEATRYAYVANKLLHFSPPANDIGGVRRWLELAYLDRAAVCLKVKVVKCLPGNTADFISVNLSWKYSFYIQYNPDSGKFEIVDGHGGGVVGSFPYTEDWLVIVADGLQGKVWVYDKHGNRLAEANLVYSGYVGPGYGVSIYELNEYDGAITTDVEVDWIALLEKPYVDWNLFKPPKGWSKIWDFEIEDELSDFDTYNIHFNLGYVEGVPPSGDTATLARRISGIDKPTRRVAVSVLLDLAVSAVERTLVNLGAVNSAYESVYAEIRSVPNDTSKLRLKAGTNYVDFQNPGDFFVFLVDSVEKKAKVYDKDGNLIAELDAEISPADMFGYSVLVYGECTENLDAYTKVDWVAVGFE